jgi:hypothetical protein
MFFKLLFAQIAEGEVQLAGGVFLDARRDTDAARIGQSFETRGDIDAVAEDVAVLDDDVALVDADAQFDAAVRREPGVTLP